MIILLILLVSSACPGLLARKLKSEEYHRLPPAFHLDNYERCLSQEDGLYCLGTFHLTPEIEPNPLYNSMKEYSDEFLTFNRTLIRRGYCVSARCPTGRNTSQRFERNATLRFERCASQWGHARALRTSLKTLHYCRSAEDKRLGVNTLDKSYLTVLYAVYALLIVNAIGTIYDFATDGSMQRNRHLLFWSARSNWRRLTSTNENSDPRLARLAPIQGHRILALVLMLYIHAATASYKPYPYNPLFLEQSLERYFGSLMSNSIILVKVFVIISCFLSTYNLLQNSQKNPLTFKLLPLVIIKRLTRITPLYLLIMGFAATWWNVGEGPLWSSVVGEESKICREKFWYHMLYISNLVEPNRTCLMQTWFLAADMQLNILTPILVIILAKNRRKAIPLLGCMFLASCVFDSILAYIFEWKPIIQIVTPERVRTMFGDEDPTAFRGASFTRMHLATWAHLDAALVGLALAFLHIEMQERGVKGTDYKWLPLFHNLGLPLLAAWTLVGTWTRENTSRLSSAALVGLERLVCCSIMGIIFFGSINVEGNLTRFFSWRGWNVLGRVSLAVMLAHWCVNMAIVASRHNTSYGSVLNIGVDAIATGLITYLIAVPLTILVEMPMQKTLDYLIFELILKLK